MKIAQVGDIHNSDGRISEWKVLNKQIADSILEHDPDIIVFTGDMFIHRDKLSQMQVSLCRKFFKEYLRDKKKIVIPGNHDTTMSSEKVDSLSAIFSYDDVKVYEQIGAYVDEGLYRFHMFPYPSRKEMDRLNIKSIGDFYNNDEVYSLFQLDADRFNILVFHGILEGFSLDGGYSASEEVISVGKDLALPPSFYRKFNYVMAGHLHKYQTSRVDDCTSIYAGCPCPLTFQDSDNTGWILWTERAGKLIPEFIPLPQKYPFITFDAGNISSHATAQTNEVLRRIHTEDDFTNARVRVKYACLDSQTGQVDHTKIAKVFKNAMEVKIVPTYIDSSKHDYQSLSFEDFQTNLTDLINQYIDERKYDPAVKQIAQRVEEKVKEESSEEERGIHFKPEKLFLANFKSYATGLPEIDFEDMHSLVGIFGPNRGGKSSLVEAIVWALYDKTLRNPQSKTVIRNGESEAYVRLTFNSYGVRYRIDRKRTEHSGAVDLYQNVGDEWIPINGADKPATEKKIQKLVGSFDIFTSIVYSAQNKIDLLINKKPSERKQIILDCLQIDVLEKRQKIISEMQKWSKEKKHNEEGKLQLLTEKQAKLIKSDPDFYIDKLSEDVEKKKQEASDLVVEINKNTLNDSKIDDLEKQISSITFDLEKEREKCRTYDSKIRQKQDQLDSYTELLNDIEKIDRGIERLNHLEERHKFYEDKKREDRERKNIKQQLSVEYKKVEESYDEQVNLLRQSKEALAGQIDKLTLLDCPSEGCPLNERVNKQKNELRVRIDDIDTEIEKKEQQKNVALSSVKDKIVAIDAELESSLYDVTEHMSVISALDEEQKKKWHELKSAVSSGRDILETIEGLIKELKEQREVHRDSRDKMVAKRGELQSELAGLKVVDDKLSTLRRNLGAINEEIKEMENKLSKYRNAKEEIANLTKEIFDKKDDIEKIKDTVLYQAKYAEIVSKSGVIYSLVDKSIPVIEKFAQDLLNETTNGMINLTMDSYKLLSKGAKSDDVSIYIHDSKGRRDIAEGSGAELFLATMALRAAMANLLSMRMGSKVELFIVDEGFGALEDNSIIMAKDMFRKLGKLFKKVIVITHVAEIQDLAETIIQVRSEDGLTSKYEIRNLD